MRRLERDAVLAKLSTLERESRITGPERCFAFDNFSAQLYINIRHKALAQSGQLLDCYLIVDQSDNALLIDFFHRLHHHAQALENEQIRRVHLIYQNDGFHYTFIDFRLTKIGIDCFIIDAADNPILRKIDDLLSEHANTWQIKNAYATSGAIQNDPDSCLNCALALIDTVSTIELYQMLSHLGDADTDTPYQICKSRAWISLPAVFVKDVQSRSFLENYRDKHPGRAEALCLPGQISLIQYTQSPHDETALEARRQQNATRYPHFPKATTYNIYQLVNQYYDALISYYDEHVSDQLDELIELAQPLTLYSNDHALQLQGRYQQQTNTNSGGGAAGAAGTDATPAIAAAAPTPPANLSLQRASSDRQVTQPTADASTNETNRPAGSGSSA